MWKLQPLEVYLNFDSARETGTNRTFQWFGFLKYTLFDRFDQDVVGFQKHIYLDKSSRVKIDG